MPKAVSNLRQDRIVFNPASFRDPEGSLFEYGLGDKVYRTLSSHAIERMRDLLGRPFFQKLMENNQIISTALIKTNTIVQDKNSVQSIGSHILEHEKVNFVSYPYEWSFSMLKDAALGQLEIMKQCLENGFILKDGSAWNTCFVNAKMCFIDVLSIDYYEEGQPWEGYSQFCQEFLFPLMIKAYKGMDFQAYWLGTLKGIPLDSIKGCFGIWDWAKKGVFKHIFLQSKLSTSKTLNAQNIRRHFKPQTLPKMALLNLVKDLQKTIKTLSDPDEQSVWIGYVENNSYAQSDTEDKKRFVLEQVKSLQPNVLIDLGCNTGEYSALAAKYCRVISTDLDSLCIDRWYKKIVQEGIQNISPLVLNLMSPSPAVGWGLAERKDIYSRFNGDAFLALALIHHLCIASNVPLDYFVKFLQQVAPQGIVEWVDKEDPMVQFLLRNRKDIFPDYTWDNFKMLVERHFSLLNVSIINNGTRRLCLLGKK